MTIVYGEVWQPEIPNFSRSFAAILALCVSLLLTQARCGWALSWLSVNFGKVIIGCVASCLSKAQSSLLDTEIVFRCLASSPSTLLKLLHRLSASLVGDHSLVGVLSSNYSNTWIPAYSDGIFMTSKFAWSCYYLSRLNYKWTKLYVQKISNWTAVRELEWILVKIWFSKKFIVIWLNGEKDN